MTSSVVTWDGELPEAEVLENPDEFGRWFDDWVEQRKRSAGSRDDREEHGWVLK